MKNRERQPAVLRETASRVEAVGVELDPVIPRLEDGADRQAAAVRSSGRPAWPTAARVTAWVGTGCAALVVIAAGLMALLIYAEIRLSEPPAKMSLSIAPPTDAAMGRPATLAISIANRRNAPVRVEAIRISRDLLRRCDVVSIGGSSSLSPSEGLFGTERKYQVQRQIGPRSSLTLPLVLKPKTSGEATGYVSLDLADRQVMRRIAFSVTPGPPAPAPPLPAPQVLRQTGR
jgi:hypothetical protein